MGNVDHLGCGPGDILHVSSSVQYDLMPATTCVSPTSYGRVDMLRLAVHAAPSSATAAPVTKAHGIPADWAT